MTNELTMFEKASKAKYRFNSAKGLLTVEDLWDLPLTSTTTTSIDAIAKNLNQKLKDNGSESFVETKSSANEDLETRFAIVKHIIKVRLAKVEATKLDMETRNKQQQILALIADKKNDELRGKSIEELEAMITP